MTAAALRRLTGGVLMALVLVSLVFLAAGTALARGLPAGVETRAGALALVGEGELRWLGFKLYDAALWSAGEGAQATAVEHALSIRYARAVSSERLVDLSLEEIARLGIADEGRFALWRQSLAAALPSVAAGETLVGLHRPGQGAAFWHQGRLTAEIDDPELARAFFAIWLDERTREPALRARLLGLADRQ